RFCDQPSNENSGTKPEGNSNRADEDREPLRIGARRMRCEHQQKQRSNRTQPRRNRPHQSARAERGRINSFQPIRPGVAKENEKKRPLTGQFDQKKRLRHRDEGRNQKRNREMPKKLRTNRNSRGGQRKNKSGNAAKPGNT